MKIGRNEPCHCGSGFKFKKCHGTHTPTIFKDSIQVYSPQNPSERIFIGSPGVTLHGISMTAGSTEEIIKSPEEYTAILNVDLSVLYPIRDNTCFNSQFGNTEYTIYHMIKKRGTEHFSTTNTTHLPEFSNIQIQIRLSDFTKDSVGSESNIFRILLSVTEKFDSLLPPSERLKLSNESHISYQVAYVKGDTSPDSKIIATTTYPYTGVVSINTSETIKYAPKELIESFFAEKFNIENFYAEKVINKITDKNFTNNIITLVFDFGFYCKQHSEAISRMNEEHIRDLLIILAKAIFKTAEAECFHYDGKLDFKIINKNDHYDFVTGELKWWTGITSLDEVYQQGTKKHFSGQESDVILILLSKNKDFQSVYDKCISYFSEKNLELLNNRNITSVKFISYGIPIVAGDQTTRLHIFIFDCFHETVKI